MPVHEYDFSVTATTGELAGQTASGSLSYEAPDPATAVNEHPDLGYSVYIGVSMIDFDFAWAGVQYTAADVLWGYVALGSDGLLSSNYGNSVFGSTCDVGGCSSPGINISYDWFNVERFANPIPGLPPNLLRYGGPGDRGIGEATISYAGSYEVQPTQVPELSGGGAITALAVLLLGLALARETRPAH